MLDYAQTGLIAAVFFFKVSVIYPHMNMMYVLYKGVVIFKMLCFWKPDSTTDHATTGQFLNTYAIFVFIIAILLLLLLLFLRLFSYK